MSSVAFVARSQLRGRWRSLAALVLVIGVVGGISISLIAGARRSSSVVARYFAHGTHYDVSVYAPGLTRAKLRSVPDVRIVRRAIYLGMAHSGPNGSPEGINGLAVDVEYLDPTFEILSGRAPRVNEPFSAMVNESFVKQYGLRDGDDVATQMFGERDAADVTKGIYHPHGPHYRFHIVGVFRSEDDVALNEMHGVDQSAYGSTNQMIVPFAFYTAHYHEFLNFGSGTDGGYFDIQLAHPGDRDAFAVALKKLDPSAQLGPSVETRRASLNTPVDFESAVLLALGVAIAIAAAVVVALLLRADQRAHARDDPTLRGLGMTRVDVGAAAALRATPVAAAGALFATTLAIALSGRYPIGVGAELELSPGRDVNLAVIAAAVGIILAIVVATAFLFGWLGGAHRQPRRNRVTLARWFLRSGAPTDVVVGTHLAFERDRSQGSMPSRSAVAGGAVALAVIAAVGVLVSGVDHLYSTPSAHGWPFDVAIGNVNFDMPAQTFHRVESDPRLASHTAANYGQATVGGQSIEVLAIADTDAPPAVALSGRLPESASEIALGPKLLGKLHTAVGGKVSFSVADGEFHPGPHPKTLNLSVVGTALAPVFGESEIGEVAVVPLAAITASGGDPTPRFVLARVRGDRVATTKALRRDLTPEMATDVTPSRVVNLHRVRQLPLLGVALAALLGLVLLAYTMAVGVRARTRGLGVLRALGMSSRRLGRVLTWQGIVLAGAMVVIGLPAGILLGTVAWRTIARQLGVAAGAVIPLWIALLLPAAIAAGVLASVLPARRLRRKDVATLLRAE